MLSIIRKLANVATLCVIIATPSMVKAQTYTLDDGTAETSVGFSPSGDIAWLNSFTIVAGQEIITDISLAWGGVSPGSNLAGGEATSVHLWGDPNNDGNPTDALLLQSVNTTIVAPDTDTIVTIDIPDTIFTVGDTFFVGGFFSNSAPVPPILGPVALDTTSNASQSWIAASTNVDLNDLGSAALFGQTSDFGLAGNLLVRAEATAATAVPEPSTVLGTLAAIGLGVAGCLKRRQDRRKHQ